MGKNAFNNANVKIDGIGTVVANLERAKPETAAYRVSADVDYAVYVEFGTKFAQAQPYLRPAVNQTMRSADSLARKADDVDELIRLLAESIAEKAQSNAPVDTGKLRNSIKVEEL